MPLVTDAAVVAWARPRGVGDRDVAFYVPEWYALHHGCDCYKVVTFWVSLCGRWSGWSCCDRLGLLVAVVAPATLSSPQPAQACSLHQTSAVVLEHERDPLPSHRTDLRQDEAMADRYSTPGGWTVEVVALADGERLRIRHHGYYVADARSVDDPRAGFRRTSLTASSATR